MSDFEPIVIRTVSEMLDHLIQIGADKGRILWYRGHRQASWNVEPTICRGYEPIDERNFSHRFRSRASIRTLKAPNFDDIALWLSLMRHYGLPTRLMDWSRSPMVAAYFALECIIEDFKANTCDSVIWVLDPHIMNGIENVKGIKDLTPSIASGTCYPTLKGAFYDEK